MIRNALLAAASAAALGLAACDDNRTARVDAPEPAPLAELTAEAADLPFADPAPVQVSGPEEGYRWAERAYGLQRAVYDTPPDYGFAYDDVEPMVWETADDWDLYAEPWDGGYRYYYYEPGAAYPYFVRDREYGYAFDAAGVLIALIDSGGRYLPRETVYRYAPTAGRYYVRGRDLRNAGLQARRIRVTDETWRVQAPRVLRDADPWLRAAREDHGWRAWRERDRDRELARFEAEAKRRRAVEHAWREREDRLVAIDRRDESLEARAAAQRQMPAQAERRRDRIEVRDQREQAQAFRRQQQQARVEQQRLAQQAQAERAQQHRQAQKAQANQRRHVQQAQAEQRRQQQVQQQQARAEQQRQAQAEQRRQQHAAQQEGRAQQNRQAHQAHAEQRRQQQAQQHPQRRQPAQQAHGADAQGQPAAAHERGHGQGHGRRD